MLIRKAAVLGAGTMGAGIACQLANAGVPCLLLDIVPGGDGGAGPSERSGIAVEAIRRAATTQPPPLMDPRFASLIEPGNLEDDLGRVAECDWIIEAVVEDLDIKRRLYARVAEHRRPGSIVSSNTSGLSLHLLEEGLDDEFREHFLITHFFNPPRHMYLLELVRGERTSDAVFDAMRRFGEVRLGKGVVECKDTPNFIANRIGVFSMASSCRLMGEVGLTVEEVDAVTGPALGRPKTASFRLHDLVGNDVAVLVMRNVKKLVPHDESLALFDPPSWLVRMVEEKKLGRKTGAGFYKKDGKDILVLDLETFEYRPQSKAEFASLRDARKGRTTGERIRLLTQGSDKAAEFAWQTISETLLYAARRIPEIADDIVSIDRAIRWGFNWELGPFEIWDALGVRESVARMEKDGHVIPDGVRAMLAAGRESFYGLEGEGAARCRTAWTPGDDAPSVIEDSPGVVSLPAVKVTQSPVLSNAALSVWDIGDDVLCAEYHTKMNAISDETLALLADAVDLAESGPWAGLVIGNDAPNFSAGANLVGIATAAAEKRWGHIEQLIRFFHRTALRIRYSQKPVIAAVRGLALGGGLEIPLACDRVQAAAESYVGLVELGVGLIPAGGGTREMACRAAEAARDLDVDFFPWLSRSFDAIAQAKVSGSAFEARSSGYLREVDGLSMNRDRILADAKRTVLALQESGYRAPPPRDAVRVAGASGLAEFRVRLHQFREAGWASDYDVHLASSLAYVLCGGEVDAETTVSESYLLDLECEVFLRLTGEEKTHARIRHMLETGKPLRN